MGLGGFLFSGRRTGDKSMYRTVARKHLVSQWYIDFQYNFCYEFVFLASSNFAFIVGLLYVSLRIVRFSVS